MELDTEEGEEGYHGLRCTLVPRVPPCISVRMYGCMDAWADGRPLSEHRRITSLTFSSGCRGADERAEEIANRGDVVSRLKVSVAQVEFAKCTVRVWVGWWTGWVDHVTNLRYWNPSLVSVWERLSSCS